MKRPFISLSSDFAVQSHGCGIMEAAAYTICPEAKVVHLEHGLKDFNILTAARMLETIRDLPIGCHVCVVDPGVGTKRRGIIIKTKRRDHLIGPDNGVLIPASRILGGIVKAVEIKNDKYMRKPVSPIFHGRDVFTPAAAYLAKGVPIGEFGPEIQPKNLVPAPYEEAKVENEKIKARVISVNKFGSFHINTTYDEWDKLKLRKFDEVVLQFNKKKLTVSFVDTFGDVEKGKPLIMKDDYGRVEVAVNQGSFIKKYKIKMRDTILISKK